MACCVFFLTELFADDGDCCHAQVFHSSDIMALIPLMMLPHVDAVAPRVGTPAVVYNALIDGPLLLCGVSGDEKSARIVTAVTHREVARFGPLGGKVRWGSLVTTNPLVFQFG